MIATIAVGTLEFVDKHLADNSLTVDMIVADKPASVALDIVDNFAAVDRAVVDIPVAVNTALADSTVVADKNFSEYRAAEKAAARFAAVDNEVADSFAEVAAAIAIVALAEYWQTFGKKSYSGDIL